MYEGYLTSHAGSDPLVVMAAGQQIVQGARDIRAEVRAERVREGRPEQQP